MLLAQCEGAGTTFPKDQGACLSVGFRLSNIPNPKSQISGYSLQDVGTRHYASLSLPADDGRIKERVCEALHFEMEEFSKIDDFERIKSKVTSRMGSKWFYVMASCQESPDGRRRRWTVHKVLGTAEDPFKNLPPQK